MAKTHTLANHFRRLYRKFFPAPCLLCGLPATNFAVCDACQADLPLVGSSCQRCALPLKSAQICGHCLQSPPPQQRSWSLYRYEGAVRHCITALKYQQRLYIARCLAQAMVDNITLNQRPDCLIPIPLHPRRLRRRGYNQALLIATEIGRLLDIPVRTDLLFRRRYTPSQSTLSAKARKRNIRHAFSCTPSPLPEHIVLIDDVMTSGATCAEASRILLTNGAKYVEVWTTARTIGNY